MRELLDALIERSSVRPRVEVDPALMRPRDLSLGDATRLRETAGWKPRVPLERTLDALLVSWRAEISAA